MASQVDHLGVVPRATIETHEAWACPHCGEWPAKFGATNPLDAPSKIVYRCFECNGLFRAPKKG